MSMKNTIISLLGSKLDHKGLGEQVSIRSTEPILLTGPTGVGKSRLAKRIYQLKKQRGLVKHKLVEVNCATLRGDNAMSTLFGHIKGAYTGAVNNRQGLLREVLCVCQESKSLAEAGRHLFNSSRKKRRSNNDSHRLRTYLAKYGVAFKDLPLAPQ